MSQYPGLHACRTQLASSQAGMALANWHTNPQTPQLDGSARVSGSPSSSSSNRPSQSLSCPSQTSGVGTQPSGTT